MGDEDGFILDLKYQVTEGHPMTLGNPDCDKIKAGYKQAGVEGSGESTPVMFKHYGREHPLGDEGSLCTCNNGKGTCSVICFISVGEVAQSLEDEVSPLVSPYWALL